MRGVSETLLVPLYYRVEESRRAGGAFHDVVAEAFHDAIAYEWEKFQGPSPIRPTTIARTLVFDDAARTYLGNHRDGFVVNLSAGLDTRFHRLEDGRVEWIDVDLPDVIAFRRALPEPVSAHHALFAGSVLDRAWIDEVQARRRARRILFLAEGFFPYFSEAEHRTIFGYFSETFRGDELFFQTSAPSLTHGYLPSSDLLKLRTSAEIKWGLEEGRDVESLNPGVRFLGEVPLLDSCRDQLPPQFVAKLSPDALRRAAKKIVHARFV